MDPIIAPFEEINSIKRLLRSEDLEQLFKQCFEYKYATVLCSGAEEPLYRPASKHNAFNTIFYRADYFSSALHEIAHWCIAGTHRRTLVDYGYWYADDGRSRDEQILFEQVEVKPQAIEAAFSQACGNKFTVSIDNLSGGASNVALFEDRVKSQLEIFYATQFPTRAQLFLDALLAYYSPSNKVTL